MKLTALRVSAVVSLAAGTVLLTSCSSSSGSSGASDTASTTTTQASSTPSSATTPTQSTSPASDQSGVATSLDPCQLVTSSEASSLAGTTFGAGKEQGGTGTSPGKQCVYGAQTRNVFTVEVGQAASPDAAQAEWNKEQAMAKAEVSHKLPPGIHVSLDTTNPTGIGDKAATIHGTATIAGQSVGFSGIYVLKGATFFAFQDLLVGGNPPSVDAMETQASTSLGRIS